MFKPVVAKDFKDLPTRFESMVKKLAAPERADPEIEGRVRGESLSEPVVWQGRQWAVTTYGLEKRDGTYQIEANRLWENEENGGWFYQIGLKNWVDVEDFIQAFTLARAHHRSQFKPSNSNTE
jgi:hypothetical protein